VEVDTDLIAGYYTLSSASIDLDRLPEELVKRLPGYPAVPVIKIGRLAVDTSFQGSGLSKAMLADIYKRVLTLEVGAYAVAVDAIDDQAEEFYLHHGFLKMLSREASDRLRLPPSSKANACTGVLASAFAGVFGCDHGSMGARSIAVWSQDNISPSCSLPAWSDDHNQIMIRVGHVGWHA